MPLNPVAPVVLGGRIIRLEPVAEVHRAGLRAAAADPGIWPWMPLDGGDGGDGFERMFAAMLAALAEGREVPFVVRRAADGEILGATRYMNIVPAHDRLEIGWTWYRPDSWGGAVNPACKLPLLAHAFELLGAERVEFKCDARNARSRRALAGIGAVEEGTLRRHLRVQNGFLRDSVYFSVLRGEWPDVRAGLEARLDALDAGP